MPVAALGLVTSGCGSSGLFGSVPGVCAGPMIESPHVVVDTAAWTTVHRDSSVRTCLDGVCQQVNGQSNAGDGAHLYVFGQAVGQPLTVTIRATRGSVTLLDTATTVHLQHLVVGDGDPCGDVSQWVAEVVLDPAGKLHAVRLPRTVTARVSAGPSTD